MRAALSPAWQRSSRWSPCHRVAARDGGASAYKYLRRDIIGGVASNRTLPVARGMLMSEALSLPRQRERFMRARLIGAKVNDGACGADGIIS